MSKPVNPGASEAAEYVLGLLPQEDSRAFAQRLAQAGKPKMAIVGAAMRKPVHIIFGVLKSGRPFDPTMHAACA
jgi:hypothetical protein